MLKRGCLILAATLLVMTMLSTGQSQVLVSRGTLVSVAPTKDGIVIAADSRSTVGNQYCDQTFKLVEVSLPQPTVVTVAGIGVVYAKPPAGTTDLCDWIKTGRRVTDIEHFAKHWLASHPEDLSSGLMIRLGTDSLTEVRELVKVSPDAPKAYAGNNFYTIAVMSYDAVSRSAKVGVVGTRFNPVTGAPEITDHKLWQFQPTDRGDVINFGLFDYVSDHVLREGRSFAAEYLAFRPSSRVVGDIASAEAVSALSNLMDATARTTRIVPTPGRVGIGGPTDILLLGAGKSPERIRWKAQ